MQPTLSKTTRLNQRFREAEDVPVIEMEINNTNGKVSKQGHYIITSLYKFCNRT